jgi:hypothetical protein
LGIARPLRTGLGLESGIKPADLYARDKSEYGNDESLRSFVWMRVDVGLCWTWDVVVAIVVAI